MRKDMTRHTILTVATSVFLGAALAGCTNQTPAERPQGLPIRLGAGVAVLAPEKEPANNTVQKTGAATRGAINDGDMFTAAVAGWETDGSGSPDYAAAQTWLSTASVVASEAAQGVTLSPERYYSTLEGRRTCMKAWHPAGTLSANGQVSFAGTPDGQTDVMLAGEISGSGDIAPGDLDFRHCLTQLRFRIASTQTQTAPVTLSSITVKAAQLPTGFDLTTDGVLYAAAADLPVPGITEGALVFIPQGAGAGTPLMIRPLEQNFLMVDIVTSLGVHENVRAAIDSDTQFIPGKAYTITLTYTGNDIQPLDATVNVTPWQDVPGGDTELPI